MNARPATVTQARQTRPQTLDPLITQWRSVRDSVEPILDRTQRDYTESVAFWRGESADRARQTTYLAVSEGGRRIVAALDQGIAAAATGITDIGAACNAVIFAVDAAEHAAFGVAENGVVSAPDAWLSLPADASPADFFAAQSALDDTAKNVHQPAIQAALANLGTTVEDTSIALEKAFEQVGGIHEIAKILPVQLMGRDQSVQDIVDGKAEPPTEPGQFHTWWTELSDEDKDALYDHDHYIGNTDGMPVADRDHYNRITLEDELSRAQGVQKGAQDAQNEVDDLLASHPDWAKYSGTAEGEGWLSDQPGYDDWKAQLDDARARASVRAQHIDDLTTLAKVTDETKHPERMLLQVDSQSGERVHAIVADGDPDSASHVTTYVPGTGSQPAKMENDMKRVGAMTDGAFESGAVRPVTIGWFGYDAPPEIPDASDSQYAQAAAPALNTFQDGLRVTHVGEESQNTVLGHSYGTTVIGMSASDGRTLDTDKMVLVASPGGAVEHVSEYSLTGVPEGAERARVYTTRAENDLVPEYPRISDAPGVDSYGPDPTSPDFGATVFESDPGTSTPVLGYNFGAHSEYWDEGNRALEEMGEILARQT